MGDLKVDGNDNDSIISQPNNELLVYISEKGFTFSINMFLP